MVIKTLTTSHTTQFGKTDKSTQFWIKISYFEILSSFLFFFFLFFFYCFSSLRCVVFDAVFKLCCLVFYSCLSYAYLSLSLTDFSDFIYDYIFVFDINRSKNHLIYRAYTRTHTFAYIHGVRVLSQFFVSNICFTWLLWHCGSNIHRCGLVVGYAHLYCIQCIVYTFV